MLQLCESVHNVHKSKNAAFFNNYIKLAYGNFYPYLSISHPIYGYLWKKFSIT